MKSPAKIIRAVADLFGLAREVRSAPTIRASITINGAPSPTPRTARSASERQGPEEVYL